MPQIICNIYRDDKKLPSSDFNNIHIRDLDKVDYLKQTLENLGFHIIEVTKKEEIWRRYYLSSHPNNPITQSKK